MYKKVSQNYGILNPGLVVIKFPIKQYGTSIEIPIFGIIEPFSFKRCKVKSKIIKTKVKFININ
jgi:hypothetical protein